MNSKIKKFIEDELIDFSPILTNAIDRVDFNQPENTGQRQVGVSISKYDGKRLPLLRQSGVGIAKVLNIYIKYVIY